MTPHEPGIRNQLVELTLGLARINSVNPTLDPTGPGEAEIAVFVRNWMQQRGWSVAEQWPAPGRPNIVGVVSGGDGPTLMINAHLDTVGGTPESLEIRSSDDALHGRGVLDTKGGLAAALLAAASFGKQGPPGDVIIGAVCDEEANSIGTEGLLRGWRPDAAVVIEPTGLDLVVGHRGFGILEVVYQGKSSHTGHREEGVNAIEPAARLIATLAQLEIGLSGDKPHPLLGHPAIQVTHIGGGTELFTVPDRCAASIEIRTVPGREDSDLAALVAAVGQEATSGIRVDHHWAVRRPAFELDADEPILRVARDALVAAGIEPRLTGAPFWTDAALLTAEGIPAFVFGPGGHGMHSDDETLEIDQLVACYEALRLMMVGFGGLASFRGQT